MMIDQFINNIIYTQVSNKSALNQAKHLSINYGPLPHHHQVEKPTIEVCLMDCKKPNKITDIVRLQQVLKKWKKVANASKNNSSAATASSSSSSESNNSTISRSSSGGSKGIKFLKRTLSFTDISGSNETVPKGFLAVCVGKELKRFIIPTDYLRHQAFEVLLREAEEEFGFQQEGVLKIPCHVSVFEKILKVVQGKKEAFLSQDKDKISTCYISDCDATNTSSHQAQMCR